MHPAVEKGPPRAAPFSSGSLASRLRAGAIHAIASVVFASLAFFVAFSLWYPGTLFDSAGGRDLVLLIACVDVTLGPLLTMVVYVPGKRGLVFDLACIVTLQLAALGYGLFVLFEARPVYIAFVKDRFEIVRAGDITDENLAAAKPPFDRLPLAGPQYVGTRMPSDPGEKFKVMMSGIGGMDLQTFPQYYVQYPVVRQEAARQGRPLARLRELNPEAAGRIDAIIARSGHPEGALRYLPMRAGPRDLTVVVSPSGDVVELNGLRPWEYR